MTDTVDSAPAPAAAQERTHGLRAGAVGFFGALAGSIGLQGPSGGASFLPALMAATVALSGPLAFALGTIVMIFVAYAFIAFSRHMSSSGSVYAFNGTALGGLYGFASVIVLLGAYVSTAGWVSIITADFVSGALAAAGVHIGWLPIAIVVLILMFTLSYRALALSSSVILVLELTSIAMLLVIAGFVIAKGGAGGHSLSLSYFSPHGLKFSILGLGIVFAFTSVSGFEGAAYLGDEAREATRNIPLAIWTSLFTAGLIYTFFSWIETSAYGSAAGLSSAALPMVQIGNTYVGHDVGVVVDIAAAISSFGSSLSALNGSSRIVYTLAGDGILPRALHAIHPKHRSPTVALALIVAAALVLVLTQIGADPLEAVYRLSTYTADTFIFVYALTVLAAFVWVVKRRGSRVEMLILAIGLVVMVFVIKFTVYPLPVHPFDYALYAAGGTVAFGAALLAVPRVRQRARASSLFRVGAERSA